MSLGRKLCRNWLFSRNLKISRLRLSQNRFFCEAKTEKNKDKNININSDSDKAKEEAKIETKSDKIRKDKIKTIGKFYQALIKKDNKSLLEILKKMEKESKKIQDFHKEIGEKSFNQSRENFRKTKKIKKRDKDNLPIQIFLVSCCLMATYYYSSKSVTPKIKTTEESPNPDFQKCSYSAFINKFLQKNLVEKIQIDESIGKLYVTQKIGPPFIVNFGKIDNIESTLEREQEKMGKKIIDFVPVEYKTGKLTLFDQEITAIKYLLYCAFGVTLLTGLFTKSNRMSQTMNIFGKSSESGRVKVSTRLKDVAGMHNVKKEVVELADFLKSSRDFKKLGARIPRGALLVGPPGTGKTLIAKAIAGESDCSFYPTSGSDFGKIFVGVGAAKVRSLFAKARRNAPSIIFIDEIDALGGKRSQFSNEENDRTLNQLLIEMDGFEEKENVIVLAGTNRADILDKALLRPGRFDRKIAIDLPDISERKEIFQVHLKPLKLKNSPQIVAERLAALTPGFSGADIANVCNEGAILAARLNSPAVAMSHFEKAFDRVIAGLERSRDILTDQQKKVVAHHEAGHAVASWFLKHADPLLKVTIKPRVGGAMGFSQSLPKESPMYTDEHLSDMMCVAFGGRIAEKMFFGQLSNGANNDLEKATAIAYRSVKEFGMSAKVGNLSFEEKEDASARLYSEYFSELMDEEAQSMIERLYKRAEKLLKEKKKSISKLAEALLKRETLTHDDVVELIGKRPFEDFHYKKYLESILLTKRE